MLTDIVGSTQLKGLVPGDTSGQRDRYYRENIKAPHDAIVAARRDAHGGHVVNPTGDGFLLAFADAEEAVLCALEIQEKLTAAAIPTPEGPLAARTGLHSGQAKPDASDYAASAADKCARVQGKAQGGQVFISRETHALVVGKLHGVGFESFGALDLRGLGTDEVFAVFRSGQNPFADLENKYRQHLVDRFGKLTLYSITSDQPLAVDLEQVFVKLTTTESRSLSRIVELMSSSTKPDPRIAEGLNAGVALAKLLGSKQPIPERSISPAESEVCLSVAQALASHTHLAVIGSPGAGKTTLLKWLALAFARRQVKLRLNLDEDRLPLFVALRDLNRYFDNLDAKGDLPSPLPPALLARHLQAYYADNVSHLELPPDFFVRALAQGRALVLLDGLDEVADAGKRIRAAEFVAACIRHYPGNRFVLTSRPRGYETDCRPLLSAHCSECRIRDFDDADIRDFARNWYLAVTIARDGDNPTARDRAAHAAGDLLAAVAQERVRPLAVNPLLLSILALIHQRGVGLPQRRVELYDECTQFLLGYWDQVRGGETGRELSTLGGLTRAEKRTLLEPVALWLHERGEQGAEVHRRDLEAQLAAQFRDTFGEPEARAKQRAREFVDIIVDRAGLLVEREIDTFAFSHLTFQEYLAARALADRRDFVKQTLRHLHDPWWREVHLLEVAHISSPNTRRSRELTGELLTAIRSAKSWLEEHLQRDLLFAFHALCDVGPLGVEDALRRKIVDEPFQLHLWKAAGQNPLRESVLTMFSYSSPTPVGAMIVEALLALSRSPRPGERIWATQGLGRLGSAAATPKILARLLALSEDKNHDVREAAANASGRLQGTTPIPDALPRLVALSRDKSADVRFTALDALARLGSGAATPDVLALLLDSIRDKSIDVSISAAAAFGRLGSGAATPDVLTRLVALSKDKNADIRYSAVDALSWLGSAAATPAVLARFLALSQDKNDVVREIAIRAFGSLGSAAATPDVLARLLALIQDRNVDTRISAANAFERLGRAAATPHVLARLLALSEDVNNDMRTDAVDAFGSLGSAAATPDVLARLVTLSKDKNVYIRYCVARALGRLGTAAATPDVLACLLALSEDVNNDVRDNAAAALGRIGSAVATPDTLKRLWYLMNDENEATRRSAGWALGQMATALSSDKLTAVASFWIKHLPAEGPELIDRKGDWPGKIAYETLQILASQHARTPPSRAKKSPSKRRTTKSR